jgi:hypothetical protein
MDAPKLLLSDRPLVGKDFMPSVSGTISRVVDNQDFPEGLLAVTSLLSAVTAFFSIAIWPA